MTGVLLATRNAGKVAELRELLAPVGIEVVGLDAALPFEDLPESANTFTANALVKARHAAASTGMVSVADDSGLCVDALGSMPGVLSARWSGRHGDDPANTALLLAQLADVPDDRRSAAFLCAAAAAAPDGRTLDVLGRMPGTILRAARGAGGFGYDPVFQPTGDERTTAEMSPQEKNAISHRGRAFRSLASLLPTLIEPVEAEDASGAAGPGAAGG